MNTHQCRFWLTLLTVEGMPLAEAIEVTGLDDEPARECARFRSFLRSGAAVRQPVAVEPRWDERNGSPFVSGLLVECGGHVEEIPRQIFEPAARRYAQALLAGGLLRKGDLYRYVVTATTGEAAAPAPQSGLNIEVIEEPSPWPFLAIAPEDLIEEPWVVLGGKFATEQDVPVYVPGSVLEEAAEMTLQSAAVETGGVILGHVCRDPETERAGLVVTAQIPATGTESGEAHLTFTPQTWAAIQRARALRRDESIICGWWHSHPANQWCKPDCSEEARGNCRLQKPFFSEMDANVHRTVFCQGYSVALVLTNTGHGIGHALYGWRAGLVQRRAFHVTGCAAPGRGDVASDDGMGCSECHAEEIES